MCVGKPETILYDDKDQPSEETLKTFYGYIECDIEPPTYLFHPVLLNTTDGFLLRHLHPIQNARLASVELQLALEKGYRMTKVKAIYHFKPSQNLFRGYMKNFLRLKIESENYLDKETKLPDEEKIATVCQAYKDAFDIILRPEIMHRGPNTALRQCAKLWCNTLWVRLGMRLDRGKEKYAPRDEVANIVKKLNHVNLHDPDRFELKEGTFPVSDYAALIKHKGTLDSNGGGFDQMLNCQQRPAAWWRRRVGVACTEDCSIN